MTLNKYLQKFRNYFSQQFEFQKLQYLSINNYLLFIFIKSLVLDLWSLIQGFLSVGKIMFYMSTPFYVSLYLHIIIKINIGAINNNFINILKPSDNILIIF